MSGSYGRSHMRVWPSPLTGALSLPLYSPQRPLSLPAVSPKINFRSFGGETKLSVVKLSENATHHSDHTSCFCTYAPPGVLRSQNDIMALSELTPWSAFPILP